MNVCGGAIVDDATGHMTGCIAPAVTVVVSGCVHEHVAEEQACEVHLALLREGSVFCRRCLDAGHRCPLFGREVAA